MRMTEAAKRKVPEIESLNPIEFPLDGVVLPTLYLTRDEFRAMYPDSEVANADERSGKKARS